MREWEKKTNALSACSADAVYLGSIQPSVKLLRAFSKFWQSFERLLHSRSCCCMFHREIQREIHLHSKSIQVRMHNICNIEKNIISKHMFSQLHLWAKAPFVNSHTGGDDGGFLTRLAKWILWPVHFTIRFNFHIYEPFIPFQWTVMELATSTQVIIKSPPLLTSVIHLCSGSLILQPITGTFNNTEKKNLWLQLTLARIRRQPSRESGSPGVTFNLKCQTRVTKDEW